MIQPQQELALARSAAPGSIANHATVLVLGFRGYRVAVKGSNGFTCLVERPWMQPFNKKPFWNVRFRAPVCYNRAAAQSVLIYTFKRTAMALSGATEAQMQKAMLAAIAAKSLPIPKPDAMAYMMSKEQYLDDGAKAWYPHVMFFMPRADMARNGEAWGADRLRSPIVYDSADMMPEPWAQFFIPVAHWSDGSPAPLYTGS
ncbi:MAG: hypothetical protein JO165_06245 [Candidatus Eremiobacteraeota bacterium]|nr:hypothetical protein [Candidatus Eremiobacteraeota bacterium]